jgi:RDD family
MASPDRTAMQGAHYRPEDYLGVFRRLLIDIVDLPIAVLLSMLLVAALLAVAPRLEDVDGIGLLVWATVWFGYFVLLKRSTFRTVGYVVARAQIVNLKGERPSVGSLIARLLFALAGPLNFVLDIMWLTGDSNRQALRDKFAGTYVVRRGARPAGTGPVVLRNYMFWGMTFLFREVERRLPEVQPPLASDGVRRTAAGGAAGD